MFVGRILQIMNGGIDLHNETIEREALFGVRKTVQINLKNSAYAYRKSFGDIFVWEYFLYPASK